MQESKFKKALHAVEEKRLEQEKNASDHVFSEEFEKNMQEMIHEFLEHEREKSKKTPFIKTNSKRAVSFAVIIIIMILGITISFAAIIITNFIITKKDTHSEIIVRNTEDVELAEILDFMEITQIPDNYELIDVDKANHSVCSTYQFDNKYFYFTQYLKSFYNANANTEGHEPETVEINGQDGFLIDIDGDTILTWESGSYVFTIEGNINKTSAIAAANSVS